jgi:predicted RNase H-like HicB family nuclease
LKWEVIEGRVERGRCLAVNGQKDDALRAYTKGMKFRIVLEFDAETNSYSAVCPELPGCASAGDTEEEARANIEEAIRLYLAPADIHLPENAKLVEVVIG